tara:strand:- start:653 stop:868 length:216 start_codon:yes stop_codon:yes gene_type:complete
VITIVTLLAGILLALVLPGGTLIFLLWLKSKYARKQRKLLSESKTKLLKTREKLYREQFPYMRSKKNKKSE